MPAPRTPAKPEDNQLSDLNAIHPGHLHAERDRLEEIPIPVCINHHPQSMLAIGCFIPSLSRPIKSGSGKLSLTHAINSSGEPGFAGETPAHSGLGPAPSRKGLRFGAG
ncbi:MAG: hypothetical protein Fur0032_06350 [Terrimicrobiaceae bacterium]